MNSRYRCQGCHERFPNPPFRKFGLSGVCSEECLLEVGKRTSSSKAKKPASSDVPPAIRNAVIKRDGSKCRYCGSFRGLHVHHVRYRSETHDHSPQNLVTLCSIHHDLVHSSKRTWQPVCLAYVWLVTVERRRLLLPQVKKLCDSLTNS